MKTLTSLRSSTMCLALTAAMAIGTGAASGAQAPQVVLRPLTPGDVGLYGLPASTEVSGGITTVGIGTPIYLEVEVDIAAASSSVNWSFTSRPAGSAAALVASPLGTNVPVYEPADRTVFKVAATNGRMMFRADLVGQYIVTAAITTPAGLTNISKTITAGTYMGLNTCALCHSGGLVAPDRVQPWQNTAHSEIFSQGINGAFGFYSKSCLPCHTVGYDTNTNAVNGGFDDVATQVGWVFPTNLVPGNWESMQTNYPSLANLANIQCENCHGPGSQHAYSLGNTNYITLTLNSGDCNQCHDAPTHHIKGTEWYVSLHANTTRTPSGSASRWGCVGCHTSSGFIDRINNLGNTNAYTTNVVYAAIGCQTCHEPHGITMPTNNPHLLRILGSVTMPDGSVVTNAGNGALCLECHRNRTGSATNMIANYQMGKPTWYGGSSSFGPHDGPQGDMVEGVNGITYGQVIPSSAHRLTVTNLCVGCHMQTVAAGDPAFLHAGGHTFHMTYQTVSGGVTNTVDKTDACAQCHGSISSFDLVRQDYNGDGVIEGVQTEVQHLLDKLSTLLPNANGVVDGTVKSSLSVATNWPYSMLEAAYNWQFVANDKSLGVHNAPYAVGLLKASIANLTGTSVAGGLPDWWVVQYFGSTTNMLGAPTANPSGDGVPNYVKYALGLDPWIPGITVTNGVVWHNITALGDSTNSVQIYTAAEIAFNTDVGKTYQIQSITELSGGWQNIGNPMAGTGNAISYLTPMRDKVQQYYRVIHSP